MKFISVILFFAASIFFLEKKSVMERSVAQELSIYGYYDVADYPDFSIEGVSAENGEKLVKEGFAINRKGKKTKIQSKHFACISCHNVVKEDINLSNPDPQSRLEYTSQLGIPFLQGTTLYGAVNRTSFYNGDYDKKYGDLVKPARNDLREAIQLCAVECAQGRDLEKWEMESIMAYLWTIDLKMTDLIFSAQEVKDLETENSSLVNNQEKIEIITSKYQSGADEGSQIS